MSEQIDHGIRFLPLTSKTGTVNTVEVYANGARGIMLLTNVTVLNSANLVLSMEVYEALSGTWATTETLNTINATGITVTEIMPSINTAGGGPFNVHFNHMIPARMRFTVTPADGAANTYSLMGYLAF